MKILDRYILKEFSRFLIMIMGLFIVLFIIIDFFERLKLFLSNHATISQMAGFIVFQIPMIISLTLPVAVLVATLITLSTFSRNSEITAMKANGISLYRIAAPIFFCSLAISAGLFFFSEWVTPISNQKADQIKYVEIKKKKSIGSFKLEQIWYRSRNSIYNFNLYDPKKNMIQGVSLYYLDSDFRPRMQIFSEKAFWQEEKWIGYQVQVITLSPEGLPAIKKYDQMEMPIREGPSDFEAVQLSPDKMGYFELRKYIQKLRAEGADTSSYMVDQHAKVAFAFVTLILTVIGFIFSVHAERSGGMARS
ncbi:MAG: LPS export ABC transporter permease LptG, partial [Syntrophaceae bacterium]|nr:LPS export ABC transporter permease LptG [Syntrophaceae bacterium]